MEDIRTLLTDIAPNIAFIKLECIEVCKVKTIQHYKDNIVLFLNVQVDEEVLQYIEGKGIRLQLDRIVN